MSNRTTRLRRPTCSAWVVVGVLSVLCLGVHRRAVAQGAEIDLGEDITFEIRPLTTLHLKGGGIVEGRLLEHDDKTIYRIRMRRPAVTRPVPKSEVSKVEPALTPEKSVLEQFDRHSERTAGVARKALKVFRGNRAVEKVVYEKLEKAAGSGDAGSMGLLVQLYIQKGKLEEAEKLARGLVQRRNTGFAHALLGRALASQQGKQQEADQAFQKALKLSPENEQVMVPAAEFLLDTGRPEKANEIFTTALKRNPNSLAALVGAGYVALRQGLLDEAVASFEKARTVVPEMSHREPRSISATLGLAAAKTLMGEHEEATKLATKVLNHDTNNAQAYGLQAYAKLMTGGTSESQALPLVEYALRSDPQNPRLKALKAVILKRQGEVLDASGKSDSAKAKYDEAGKLLSEVGDPSTDDPWAAYVLASILFQQNRQKEALPLFQRAATLNSTYAPAHQAVGATALAIKEWVIAEEAYRKAIALNDQVAEYHAGLGLALLGRKQVTQAREVLKKAMQMDASNVQALCGLGYIANLEKNKLSMRDLFHKALACDGNCEYAAQALAKLYAFHGQSVQYIDFSADPPSEWRTGRGAGRMRPTQTQGVLLWQGQQGSSASPRILWGTNLKAEEFVRFEADLAIVPDNACIMALRLGSAVGANVAFYFEVGKDPSNRLAYRLQDYGGPRDWTPLGEWPKEGKIRLAIESPDLSSGKLQLFVNGEPKGTAEMQLARVSRISVGVFLQAPPKANVSAYADNIVFISRSPVTDVPDGGPTELKPALPARKNDVKAKAEEKKTP